MGLRVVWVPYGRAAADALRRVVGEAKGDDPLAPVTVVVPSNHVGVATRRLLASGTLGPVCSRGTGLAAVTFLTPYRLAELLGAARLAAAGRRPVSTPVITAALRAALAEAPGVFRPVAEHPATETALVAAYRELRDCSAAALDTLAATSRRAGDVVRLHRAARARLEPDWYDEEDLIVAAAGALAGGSDGAGALSAAQVLGLGAVVVYLPQRLSRHEAQLLAAVAVAVAVVVVVAGGSGGGGAGDVTVVAGTTGNPRADAEVAASVARLAELCGAPIPAGPPAAEPLDPAVAAGRTRFVTASDADDEVRAALRAVIDAVRNGTPLDRIAVLYAQPEPYARLVHEHLAAAGVPANGAAVTPVAARVAGRTLLGLLALPEGGFRRQDVLAWLSGAPVLHHGRFAPVSAWERLSREAAVVAGVDQWDGLLTRLAGELDAKAEKSGADPDAPAWRAGHEREEAARARSLREFVLGLASELAGASAGPRPWGEQARWAAGLLQRLLGGAPGRDGWPSPEHNGAERVELALARLGALDAVEGPVTLAVFTRTLALELESDLGRVGRFGEGVLVGTVAMGIGLDLDLVVVLGLVEGSFPTPPGHDSLLPDHERAATGGELDLRRGRVDRQHRQLLAALAGAARHTLGVPRGDLRRSAERVPSRFALELASVLAGERWWSADLTGATATATGTGAKSVDWVDHIASFDAGLRRLAFPATDQEHRLRTLLAAGTVAGAALGSATGPRPGTLPVTGDPGGTDTGRRLATPSVTGDPTVADPVLAAGVEVVTARRSYRFTRFDGNLAGLHVPSPAEPGTVTSPTGLELWADCPLAYLLQNVLRAASVDNPEEALQITALDWGSLVHQALERFILEVLARPAAERPAPHQPWPAADRDRLLRIGEEVWDEYQAAGLTGRAIFWRRDKARVLTDLDRFLAFDDKNRAQHGTRPLAAELAFGFSRCDLEAVPLELPDGRVVSFRGKADRVDLGDDGTVHIVDYKTGSPRGYEDLSEDDPVAGGRKLQLAVYGVAAARLHQAAPGAPVMAEYWFTSKKGQFKRIGYPVSADVLAKAGAVLGTMVEGIEHGVFPARPSTKASTNIWVECRVCDPDDLGVVDLRRAWDRKRHDPALAAYANLAEPLEAVAPEVETLGDKDGDGDGAGNGDGRP